MQEATFALVRIFQRYTFSLDPTHHPGPTLDVRTAITLSPANGVWLRVAKRAP